MEKNINLLVALVVLVIGFAGGYLSRGNQNLPVDNFAVSNGGMMGNRSTGMGGAMGGMMSGISDKSGDEFDRAFLSEMIMHHQGAVVMAQAALRDAEHEEIKQLTRNIIETQTAEIEQMQEWYRQWYAQ